MVYECLWRWCMHCWSTAHTSAATSSSRRTTSYNRVVKMAHNNTNISLNPKSWFFLISKFWIFWHSQILNTHTSTTTTSPVSSVPAATPVSAATITTTTSTAPITTSPTATVHSRGKPFTYLNFCFRIFVAFDFLKSFSFSTIVFTWKLR